MPNEEDPKEVARQELRTPEAQKMLRQFLSVDGPKGVTDAYRQGYDAIDWRKECRICGAKRPSAEMIRLGVSLEYACKDRTACATYKGEPEVEAKCSRCGEFVSLESLHPQGDNTFVCDWCSRE